MKVAGNHSARPREERGGGVAKWPDYSLRQRVWVQGPHSTRVIVQAMLRYVRGMYHTLNVTEFQFLVATGVPQKPSAAGT